jgi:uncharacterized protein (TIGR02147 family)
MLDSAEIVRYTDYRKLLRDAIDERRDEDARYSLIYFSRLIGTSDSYLKLVANGKRSLNIDKARVLARKLRFKEPAISYFLTLVMRDKAHTTALQRYYDGVLLGYRKLSLTYSQKKYATIFNDVLMWEIFSLVGVEGFSPDPKWIAGKLRRKGAATAKIERCLADLVRTGAVTVENGKYKAHDIVLEHDKTVNYSYTAALRRAIESLETDSGGDPHFDSFCLLLSEDEYAAVTQLLVQTRQKVAELVRRKEPKTMIAFLNMALFRASR